MSDKLDIRTIFRVDQAENYNALALIWATITSASPRLDLQVAGEILKKTQGGQLKHTHDFVHFEKDPFVAHVFYDAAKGKAEESVTFFTPVYREDGKPTEGAPIAMNKSEKLDFAMLVNFGCCSSEALSLVVMANLNGKLNVVQKDADNVKADKRGFFETLFTRQMQTLEGSHVAMHAIGQKHDCASHGHDHFKPKMK